MLNLNQIGQWEPEAGMTYKLWYFDFEGNMSTATFVSEKKAQEWAEKLDLEIFKIEKE